MFVIQRQEIGCVWFTSGSLMSYGCHVNTDTKEGKQYFQTRLNIHICENEDAGINDISHFQAVLERF